MPIHHASLILKTTGPGLYEFTPAIVLELQLSRLRSGVVTVFCRHTSASLIIMENADPGARSDLVGWLDRLVPARDESFTHTHEGPDDMPAHIKMALTRTSESIPFVDGRLQLGTWQGVFLWEHRRAPHSRQVLVTVVGE
jgi:secondary thiamine-phosphate synthase enzyme